MKVMSKSKEYIVIPATYKTEFYIEIGKYLDDDQYKLEPYCGYKGVVLKINNAEIKVRQGDFILVDTEKKRIMSINQNEFESDYVELKEDN